jgi:hypothetical protein
MLAEIGDLQASEERQNALEVENGILKAQIARLIGGESPIEKELRRLRDTTTEQEREIIRLRAYTAQLEAQSARQKVEADAAQAVVRQAAAMRKSVAAKLEQTNALAKEVKRLQEANEKLVAVVKTTTGVASVAEHIAECEADADAAAAEREKAKMKVKRAKATPRQPRRQRRKTLFDVARTALAELKTAADATKVALAMRAAGVSPRDAVLAVCSEIAQVPRGIDDVEVDMRMTAETGDWLGPTELEERVLAFVSALAPLPGFAEVRQELALELAAQLLDTCDEPETPRHVACSLAHALSSTCRALEDFETLRAVSFEHVCRKPLPPDVATIAALVCGWPRAFVVDPACPVHGRWVPAVIAAILESHVLLAKTSPATAGHSKLDAAIHESLCRACHWNDFASPAAVLRLLVSPETLATLTAQDQTPQQLHAKKEQWLMAATAMTYSQGSGWS